MSKVSAYIKRFGKFVFDYKFTILVMIYIALVAFIPIDFAPSIPMTVHVASFLALLAIFSKIKYSFPFIFILSIVLTFNAYFAFTFGSDVSIEVVASIFETTSAEAISMLKKIWLICIVVLGFTTALLYFSVKELKESKISLKISLIALVIYLLIFIPAISYRQIAVSQQKELFKEFPMRVAQDKINMYAPILYGNISTLLAYKEEINLFHKFANQEEKTLPEGITFNDTIVIPDKIYLVIGESAYREHLSLYGYRIKTTPFLDSLKENSFEQIKYYNGIAGAAFTRNALRIAFSFATPRNTTPFYEEKTLINLANDAGYETYWISNQGKSGIEDSYLGYIAAGTNEAIFPSSGYLADDDFILLPPLKRIHTENKKQLFVLHLVGSHNDYSDRYDNADARAIEKSNTLDYDRSIHHTDRVLKEIYNVMQQDSTALLYYFSDHGEIVGKGHGPWKHGRAQYEIPIVTINKNLNRIDSIIPQYIDQTNKTINNSSTIYIIAEAMGYQIPKKYIEQSKEDGQYVRHADQSYSLFSAIKEKPE